MFINFDPLYLILLTFLINFIPGSLISFSILKEKKLLFIEKIFIGFIIGLMVVPIVPFLLSLIQVAYSFELAIFSVLLFYAFAIYLVYTKKPWEEYSDFKLELNRKTIISLFLILIVFLTFWIRIQSYSPIFFDLDPYFYLYSSTQILQYGIPPLDDQTAWYPEIEVDHRNVPMLSYLESVWYSFYTSGGEYNNYLLALVASFYPPIMAMLAVFSLYLFVSSVYKREFALFAAAVASFITILVLKLAASEFEVQAYAFFSIAFFLAMYALSIKNNDYIYALLASIGFAGIYLGSSSLILGVTALMIFIPLHSILLFLRSSKEELFSFFKLSGIVVVLGFIIPTILSGLYKSNFVFSHLQYAIISVTAFSGLLYLIKDKISDTTKLYKYFGGFILVSILLIAFTPIGSFVITIAKGGLSIAQFSAPLHRTIQEQGSAGANLVNMLGFIGSEFKGPEAPVFSIFSSTSNFVLSSFVNIGNSLFGTSLSYVDKVNSPMMVILFFTFIALLSSFYRSYKSESKTLTFLFLSIIIPTVIIGLIKFKYTIYAGFFLSAAFAISLGELFIIIPQILQKLKTNEENVKKYTKYVFYAFIFIGVFFSYMQFSFSDLIPGILSSSLQPRFQDNPLALQEKFQDLCNYYTLYGGGPTGEVCAAAKDPIGFASQGTEFQYSQELCLLSLVDGKKNPTALESNAYQYRCVRLSDYWVESLEWMKNHPDENMRITSWWDYGHWINYFGEKNTVLRNEHASPKMIGEVAHAYLKGTPEELKEFMIAHDSEYALFDSELLFIVGNPGLGGKYGALNYLSCARNNQTSVAKTYMQSSCEWDQLWEAVFVPLTQEYLQECTISELSNKKGIVVFKQTYSEDSSGNIVSSVSPEYCLGKTTLVNGLEADALYYLNGFYENGDLKLNKAILLPAGSDGQFNVYHLMYSKDPIFVENGEVKSGWEDRSTQFYDSNLYNAFFLKDLEGFELVFESSNGGNVKIFKIK